MKVLDFKGLKRYDERIKDILNSKQETLSSGNNIKTINGQDILGYGDLVIEEPTSISDEEIGNLFDIDILENNYVPKSEIQNAINDEY